MRIRFTVLFFVSALAFSGCASAPPTPLPAAGDETRLDFANPEWAPFADYFKPLTASIQQQWYRILAESRALPARGSAVVIQLKLHATGNIEVVDVEDKGCGKLGVRAAIAAIDASGPHPKWTDEMIARLGTEQAVTFSFTYQ